MFYPPGHVETIREAPGSRAAQLAQLPRTWCEGLSKLLATLEQFDVRPLLQRKLLDVFPNSRWLPIPECGHVAYIEQPQRFFGNLLAFMRARSVEFQAS